MINLRHRTSKNKICKQYLSPQKVKQINKRRWSMKIFKNEVKELNADKPKEEDSDGDKKSTGA